MWDPAVCVRLTGSSKALDTKEIDLEGKPEESQPPYHVLARNLLYPGSHTLRFPVPDEKVPWEVGAVTLGSGAGRRLEAYPGSGGKRNPSSHLRALVLPSPGTIGFLVSLLEAPPKKRASFLLGSAVLGMPGDAWLDTEGTTTHLCIS